MATYIPGVTDVFPEPALFTPDFSFIDKMLQRRQKLYEQGFAQINSKYKWIDRDVTNPANQQIKDRFLRESRQNLKNLSALDLSQADNVNAALSVFEPIVKNTGLLGDQMITEYWDQQLQIGEGYRLKDGGKQFSEGNLAYIKMQKDAFAQDDPSSWGFYYQNKRSFSPYYDYRKERAEAMKNFKPSSYEIDKVNGLDVITEKDASAKEADIRRYLEGVLSENAKRQMKIDGVVKYGGDLKNLGKLFIDESEKELMLNNMNIDKISKDLNTIKDPGEKALLQTYVDKKKEENDMISKNIDSIKNSIKNGDLSYIKNNSENIAYSIFYNEEMSQASQAFSYRDVTFKIKGYESGLALMKEAEENKRQLRGFAHSEKMQRNAQRHAEYMERLKNDIENSINAGEFIFEKPSLGEGAPDLKISNEAYQEVINSISGAQNLKLTEMKKYILEMINSSIPDNKQKLTFKDMTTERMALWLKQGGPNGKPISRKDPVYTYISQINELEKDKNVYKNTVNAMRNEAFENLSSSDKKYIETTRKQLAGLSRINVEGAGSMSAQDIREGLENGTYEFIPASTGFFGSKTNQIVVNSRDPNNPSSTSKKTYVVNDPASLKALSTIVSIQSNSAYKNYRKEVNKQFEKSGSDQRFNPTRARPVAGSNAEKMLNSALAGAFPQYNVQTQGVGVSYSNQGDAYYSFTSKGGKQKLASKKDLENIRDVLISKGYNTGGRSVSVIGTDGGGYELKVSGLDLEVTNLFKDLSASEIRAVKEVESYQGRGHYYGTPFSTKVNDNIKYRMYKKDSKYYLQVDGIDGNILGASGFDDPTDVISRARLLSLNDGYLLDKYLKDFSPK